MFACDLQVQRDGDAGAEPERPGRVRRGLDRAEPVGVHGVHARRRRAAGRRVRAVREANQPAQGIPLHGLRQLQPLRGVLPRADDREGRPRAGKRDERREGCDPSGRAATARGPVVRRRRARAQHRALVEPAQDRQSVSRAIYIS
jgi:hypothetical protein